MANSNETGVKLYSQEQLCQQLCKDFNDLLESALNIKGSRRSSGSKFEEIYSNYFGWRPINIFIDMNDDSLVSIDRKPKSVYFSEDYYHFRKALGVLNCRQINPDYEYPELVEEFKKSSKIIVDLKTLWFAPTVKRTKVDTALACEDVILGNSEKLSEMFFRNKEFLCHKSLRDGL